MMFRCVNKNESVTSRTLYTAQLIRANLQCFPDILYQKMQHYQRLSLNKKRILGKKMKMF